MPLSPNIEAVLEHHFAPVEPPVARENSDADDLLRIVGLDPERGGLDDRLVADAMDAARRAGIERNTLVAVAQAYARGLGRVVAAESDNFRRHVKLRAPAERAAYLDELLSRNVPAAATLFAALHRAMLHDALEDSLTDESLEEPEVVERAIALVDICDSTSHLSHTDLAKTHQLVDELFEAGRVAVVDRPVWVVKYVGDGVFLLGRDVKDVADAALHAIDTLEDRLPLRARAGVAMGPVVRRAGDYFGLTVNIAERLTALADPGTLLASERVAGALPPDRVGERRELEPRGVGSPMLAATVEPNR